MEIWESDREGEKQVLKVEWMQTTLKAESPSPRSPPEISEVPPVIQPYFYLGRYLAVILCTTPFDTPSAPCQLSQPFPESHNVSSACVAL